MSIGKYAVSRDDNVYQAWPDLALTRKGKLVCVFTEVVHHLDRSWSRVVLEESVDRGRTWSDRVPLTEETSRWDTGRISRLRDDRLVILCDKAAGPADPGVDSVTYLWLGDPEGGTWRDPVKLPSTGGMPDKMVELPSGRWVFSDTKANPNSGYDEQFLWYSDDQGLAWTGPICMAACAGLRLCEASMVPLPDGTLVAFLREDSGVGRDCYKAISTDQGESWEGPYQVPLPGCQRPVAGMLTSGNIMITYRFTQGGRRVFGDSMQNFFAALTDVESAKSRIRCEQSVRIMPIDYDRSAAADLGYSGWVQFEDGEIYVVSYIVDDAPKGQIRGYSLREGDFMLPSAPASG